MMWEGIVEFEAVAQTRSFTRAAARLNTSGAQISRKVASLERRLGVKLFNRTTRSVSLTEAGALYYAKVSDALSLLSDADNAMSELQKAPTGLIKMTAPVAYGEAFIAPLVNQFLRRYPDVRIDCQFTNDRVDIVEQGIDVAIRIGALEDSTLVAKKLATRQLFVCGSPDYFRQYPPPATPFELRDHQCLIGSQTQWRFRTDNKAIKLTVKGRARYNSGNALRDAALQGIGLVQLPEFYVKKNIASGELLEVLSESRDEREGVWALFPASKNMALPVRSLIDYIASQLADSN
jgi:DNA-binding transcriptional LysR family regulator